MNNNTNDKISLNCPNCGGTVCKNDNTCSANCPFCGSEIWFNEIKEEAEVIRIRDNYEQAMSQQNDSIQQSEKYYRDLKRWKIPRNILLAVIFLLGLCSGISGGGDQEINENFFWPVLILALTAPLFLAMFHPLKKNYPKIHLKPEKGSVVALQFLFLIVQIILSIIVACLLGVFAAFFLLEFVLTPY